MTDTQLINFANSELNEITVDAKTILHKEFLKRGIDTSVFKEFDTQKNFTQNNVYTSEPLSSFWTKAFNDRKKRKSDENILHELRSKGLSNLDAELIIKRLPNLSFKDEKFESLVLRGCSKSSFRSRLVLIGIFAFSAYGLYMAVLGNLFMLIITILFSILGIYGSKKFSGEFKGGEFWVNMIRKNPDNIVWIKPIIEKTTLYSVVTLFKEKQFQFLTKEKLKIRMKCDTEDEQKIFVEGVRHYLPHAQFGYSSEIASIYRDNPLTFLDTLMSKEIYTPIDRIS